MRPQEDRDTRLKRLKIRSWRRGTREMDLILGSFFDARGRELDGDSLDLYESLLSENDHDLYAWIAGREAAPERFAEVLAKVVAHRSAL